MTEGINPPMLKHADERHDRRRPEISELLERLTGDSRSWIEAELALARVEMNELKAQAVRAAAFAVIGFAAVLCALLALSQAGIALLAPYVGGAGIAALVVCGLFVVLVIASVLGLRGVFSWQTESIFFRWFGHQPPREDTRGDRR